MRVLYFQYEASLFGTSKSLLALIDGLQARGDECGVVLRKDGALRSELEQRGVSLLVHDLHPFLCPRTMSAPRRLAHSLRIRLEAPTKRLRNYCTEFAPDLIHTNSIKSYIGGRLSRQFGVPHIGHVRSFPRGSAAVGMDFVLGERQAQGWLAKNIDQLIFVSQGLRDSFHHIDDCQANVIYNGVVSEPRINKTPRHFQSEREPLLLYVGRIDDFKDPFIVVRALRKLIDNGLPARLQIAGDGADSDIERLCRLIDELGLNESVELLGFCDDVFELFPSSSVFVMSSRNDAFGRVTAEALAMGVPVVVAEGGANQEVIENGECGITFKPHTPDALADAIRQVISNPQETEQRVLRGLQRAGDFSLERYIGQVMELYDRMTAPRLERRQLA